MITAVASDELRKERGLRILACDSKNRYSVKLAESEQEIAEAQSLRFQVFNLELNQGLAESFITGRDADLFDPACDHLMVRETGTGALVGTYRLQTGTSAKAHHDYYSAGEFDLSPLEPYRSQIVELGRACVHKAHRNVRVLSMLWRGIGNYLALKHARYLLGCSSLDSQNPAEGVAVYRHLQEKHLAPAHFRVEPWTDYACHSTEVWTAEPKVPGLLAAYFSLGAYICGSPALDREFGTIDFLTVLDMQRLNPRAAALYLGPEWKQIHAAFSESSPSPA